MSGNFLLPAEAKEFKGMRTAGKRPHPSTFWPSRLLKKA